MVGLMLSYEYVIIFSSSRSPGEGKDYTIIPLATNNNCNYVGKVQKVY